MKLIAFATSVFAAALVFTACANVRVRPVQNDAHGSQGIDLGSGDSAVRFYRPAPHVHVGRTKDGLTMQIVMLPDYSEEYAITWSAGLGSAKPSFELEGGWMLTAFDSDVDSAASSIFSSLTTLAGSLAALDGSPVDPGLYRLEAGADGKWSLGDPVFKYQQP